MDEPLTIRNLTLEPIELQKCEYYQSLPTRGITSLWRNASSPAVPPISDPTMGFLAQDVSFRIESFQSLKTDIKSHAPNQILRLTFDTKGERHRLDLPNPTSRLSLLTPLNQSPKFNYTAVHLVEHSQLTLYSSADPSSWMRFLKDDTPLSALSIPGTHNSPTCHRAFPSVRCQATSPPEQLENGVRFFDIRVQPEDPQNLAKELLLVHGAFPISLTGSKYFHNLLKEVYAFLERHPSEAVIMSIKREGTGSATDAHLSRILKDHFASDPARWFTAPRIPYLGEARGKIVLVRRFALEDLLKQEWGGAGWGIDAQEWADNTPNATCPSGDICVQDFYEVLETINIDKKIKYAQEHLERASRCKLHLASEDRDGSASLPKQPFHINFLTASNFWKVGCWPEKIAARINPAIVDFLCLKHNENECTGPDGGDGSTGIVVCDWVGHKGDWDLVRCIVGMNARLMVRKH